MLPPSALVYKPVAVTNCHVTILLYCATQRSRKSPQIILKRLF